MGDAIASSSWPWSAPLVFFVNVSTAASYLAYFDYCLLSFAFGLGSLGIAFRSKLGDCGSVVHGLVSTAFPNVRIGRLKDNSSLTIIFSDQDVKLSMVRITEPSDVVGLVVVFVEIDVVAMNAFDSTFI
jgi:hypothetical protein